MIEEYEKKKRNRIALMRSILDYGMGIFILLGGAFLLFRDKFDLAINKKYPPEFLDKFFAVICLIYGAWRIYRGYKKNYFY